MLRHYGISAEAHEQGELTLEELQLKVNDQYRQQGQPLAFTLPECEVEEAPLEAQQQNCSSGESVKISIKSISTPLSHLCHKAT